MTHYIPFLTEDQVRVLLLSNRVVQWISAVVVLGINSYLINTGPRGLFITYMEVVAAVSVVLFIPAFVSPFLSTPAKDFVLFIDVILSYLWITAFIFSAVNYNQNDCHLNAPPGVACSKKWALEAFIFITFILTFFALFIETLSMWIDGRDRKDEPIQHEKQHHSLRFGSNSHAQGTGHNTAETPVATPAAGATTPGERASTPAEHATAPAEVV